MRRTLSACELHVKSGVATSIGAPASLTLVAHDGRCLAFRDPNESVGSSALRDAVTPIDVAIVGGRRWVSCCRAVAIHACRMVYSAR